MLKKTSLILLTSIIISCGTNFIALANTVTPKLIDYDKTNEYEETTNSSHLDIIDTARIYEINKNEVSIKENSNLYNNNELVTTSNDDYIATYTMEATAYSNDSITKMGAPTKRDSYGLSTIAVDPNVIPLGSKVYIPEYGHAIASDTGGAIKGNRVDLFLNSEKECISWGRRNVTVNVVALPGEW